jgi:uncharacterized protein YkwD
MWRKPTAVVPQHKETAMRRVIRLTAALAASILMAFLGLAAAAVPALAATPPRAFRAPASAPDPVTAAADFAWVNSLRAAQGVAPLQVQPWAQGVAQQHSIDMANSESLYHNMTGYMDLGHSAMNASFLGENVAMGTTLAYAQNALLNSPPHMQNILDPRFNYVGVGAAIDASGQVWITEDFAQIAAAAPPAPAPAPKPVTVAPPAPKPAVVVPQRVIAKPVAAASPAPAPSPPPPAPAPAAVATPVVTASPSPAANAPAAKAPAATTTAMRLDTRPVTANQGALVLDTALGVLGAVFALGLGFQITRLFPGR